MGQIMTKYRFETPTIHLVAGAKSTDIQGMHILLQQEGCPNGENKFTDEPKAIYLDALQERIAKHNKTDKKSSVDYVICVANHRVMLAEAKFKVGKVENIDKKELEKKINDTKSILRMDDYSFLEKYFILFKSETLQPTKIGKLARKFSNSPKYKFITATEFYGLFE